MAVMRVEDGDIFLPEGASKFPLLGEPEATLQNLRDIFKVHVGDWFLNLTAGLDREILTGKLSSLVPAEVEVRRVLLRVPGVTSVIQLRVRRLKSLAEATAIGADAVDAWTKSPNRVLYVQGVVTSKTAGSLDLGIVFPLAPTP